MANCWERAVPLAFHLCFYFSSCLIVQIDVPFPFVVYGRMWNSIVPVPDHCLFIYFSYSADQWIQADNCLINLCDS